MSGSGEWLSYIKCAVVFVALNLTLALSRQETFAQLQVASAVLSRSRDLHPPLILRRAQHERPRPLRGRLGKNLIKGEGMERSHIIQFLGSPSRASGKASTSLTPRRTPKTHLQHLRQEERNAPALELKPNSGAGTTVIQGSHFGRVMRDCAREVNRCQRLDW